MGETVNTPASEASNTAAAKGSGASAGGPGR